MKSKVSTGYLTQHAKEKAQRFESSVDSVPMMPQINDSVYEKIMSCPLKRKLVLSLIRSEKDNIEEYKKNLAKKKSSENSGSPLRKVQKKYQCESPTALLRRRALEQQNLNLNTPTSSDVDSCTETSGSRTSSRQSIAANSPVPFNTLLKGVVAYVEIKSENQDRSTGVRALTNSMGATVRDTFTRDVTHVIFKDGSFTTYQKANLMNIHLVSVLWLEACRSSGMRVSESKFPALGTDAYDHNVSKLCSQMQKEYEEIIKEEFQRSILTGTPLPSTKTLIDRRRTIMTPKVLSTSYSQKKFSQEILSTQDREVSDILRHRERRTGCFSESIHGEMKLSPGFTSDDDSDMVALIDGKIVDVNRRNTHRIDHKSGSTKIDNHILNNTMDSTTFATETNPVFSRGISSPDTSDDIYTLKTPKIKSSKAREIGTTEKVDDNLEGTPKVVSNKCTFDSSEKKTRSNKKTKKIPHVASSKEISAISNSPVKVKILSNNISFASPNMVKGNATASVLVSELSSDKTISNIGKSSSTNMSSLQLSTSKVVSEKHTVDSAEKTRSNKKTKKILDVASSEEIPSLSYSPKVRILSKNISVPSPNMVKGNATASMPTIELSGDTTNPNVGNSSSTNMSSLQISMKSSEISNVSSIQIPAEPDDINEQMSLMTKTDSRRGSSAENKSFISGNSFSPVSKDTINSLLYLLDDKPEQDNITRRKRRVTRGVSSSSRDLASCRNTEENQSVERNISNRGLDSKKRYSRRRTTYCLNTGSKESDAEIVPSKPNLLKSSSSPDKLEHDDMTRRQRRVARKTSSSTRAVPANYLDTEVEKSVETNISKRCSGSSEKRYSRRKTIHCLNTRSLDIDVEREPSEPNPLKSVSSPDSSETDGRKNRKARKLYNPDSSIAELRLCDEKERENLRLKTKKRKSDEGVFFRPNIVPVKPNVLMSQKAFNFIQTHNLNVDKVLNKESGESDSEPHVSVGEIKVKKPKTKQIVNNFDDEQRELAEEMLAEKNRLKTASSKGETQIGKHLSNYVEGPQYSDESIVKICDKNDEAKTKILKDENMFDENGKKSTDVNMRRKFRKGENQMNTFEVPRSVERLPKEPETDIEITPRPDSTSQVSKRKTSVRWSQRVLKKIDSNGSSSCEDEKNSLQPRNRRSSLEFQVKTPTKRKHLKIDKVKKPSIVCTKMHKDDIQIFTQIVRKLGVFVIEDEVTSKTTHLVAGEPKRTINMLRAIANGCWILKKEWLFKSLEATKWLPEEDFEESDFSPVVQKSRMQRQAFGPTYSLDVFRECGPIYVAKDTIPRCSDLRELVTWCQGEDVPNARSASIVVGGTVKYDGVTCVSVNWLLDSITFGRRMPFRKYILKTKRCSILV